jgi:hypothetical protein
VRGVGYVFAAGDGDKGYAALRLRLTRLQPRRLVLLHPDYSFGNALPKVRLRRRISRGESPRK